MMDFLKPPTDNLYKFMTIMGLILFLVSVTYPSWLAHRTMRAAYEANRDYELLLLDVEKFKKKSDDFEREYNRQVSERPAVESELTDLEKQASNLSKLSSSRQSAFIARLGQLRVKLRENQEKAQETKNASDEAALEAQKKRIELSYKLNVGIWEGRAALVCIVLGGIGGIAGVLLCVFGFNLWSLRVQVYQDAILRKQAELESGSKADPAGS